MSFKPSLLTLLVLPALLLLSATVAPRPQQSASQPAEKLPWDLSFAGSPLEIRDAARRLVDSKESGIVILLNETAIVLDASSRARETRRLVYRIGTDDPDEWAIADASWQPWRQDRPELRARVVTSDGREVRLDPATLAEAPLSAGEGNIFGDTRMLRAPLPAIGPGAVVEVEFVVKDREPLMDRGLSSSVAFGMIVPALRTTLSIEAPENVPLKYALHRLPDLRPLRTSSGGNVKWTFESGRADALKPIDYFLPALDGGPRFPYVAYSTGVSWNDVAGAYSRIVDNALTSSSVQNLVRETVAGATGRQEIIERLLQKVQRNIRYAAVQLGNAAIVPTSPDETLRLEYGDCKDQAALLVSMLRTAGIEAHVALLRAGEGPQPEAELPGFGEFDHAIVYIPGDTPIWIDSTTRFSRAGQLPPPDEGRLALIAKPDTSGLVRISGVPARTDETVEVFLAEDGAGRIVTDTRFFGMAELMARAGHNELLKPEDLQKRLEEAADLFYDSRKVSGIERSEPTDFSAPFRLKFDVADSTSANTDEGNAAFLVSIPGIIVDAGLAPLIGLEDDALGEGLLLPATFTRERKYRIHSPAGFRPGTVPAKKTELFGPITLTSEFQAETDGTVTGTVRISVAKREMLAKDIADLKNAVEKLGENPQIEISFQQIAAAYFEEGKTREGLAELRRLVNLHPQEALHHSHLARELLQRGMGEAAREEARRAVEVEPGSAAAHDALGFVLEHDLLGRRWKSGFDPALARKAFEKALELAPDHLVIRFNFALLLEHNAAGHEFGVGADLDEAIKQRRLVHDKLEPSSPARINLPLTLLKSGRLTEARALSSSPAETRLVAIAATDGVAAATRELGRLASTAQSRQQLLLQAAATAMQSRLYDTAAALYRAAANGPGASDALLQQAQTLEGIKRYESFPVVATDPASIAAQFFVDVVALGKRGEELAPALSKAGQDEVRRNPSSKPALSLQLGAPPGAGRSDLFIADLLRSQIKVTVDGSDALGYRASISPISLGPEEHIYLIREEGQYRVLTAGRSDLALARGALERAERGDLEAARKWLDWAGDDVRFNRGDLDYLAGDSFNTVWLNSLRKDRDGIRRSAAALLSAVPELAQSNLAILTPARQTTDSVLRDGIDTAYVTALLAAGRGQDALTAARQMRQRHPSSRTDMAIAIALLDIGRLDELQTTLQAEIKGATIPDRDTVIRLAATAIKRGDPALAESTLRQLPEDSVRQRRLAWMSLYRDSVTPDDLSLAQRAATARNRETSVLRTLAALHAEMGRTDDAMTTFQRWLESSGTIEPAGDDWYILGRIYESIGENTAAAAAYKKVSAPKGFAETLDSAHTLAQRRLKTLGAP